MKREITVTINGKAHTETVEHRMLLVDFLREIVGLTGTHVGCAVEGRCGVCTVIYNGAATKSCMLLAVQADDAVIMTVEGLAQNGILHPLQQAMHDCHALQCGYCTPGFLMTLYDYLKSGSDDAEQIRRAMTGVLCRCTGYVHIVEAVQQAARALAAMPADERARWFPF